MGRIFNPILDISLKSKVELRIFWTFLQIQPVARRGNRSNFWSKFGAFPKSNRGIGGPKFGPWIFTIFDYVFYVFFVILGTVVLVLSI